jgi:hypothetical protein
MYRISAVALIAAIAVPLGACANLGEGRSDEGPTSVTFNCDEGKTFLAMFSEDRRRSFVRTDDETYDLVLVDRDGDELEYRDEDGVQLTVDDDESRLAIPGDDDFEDCDT